MIMILRVCNMFLMFNYSSFVAAWHGGCISAMMCGVCLYKMGRGVVRPINIYEIVCVMAVCISTIKQIS